MLYVPVSRLKLYGNCAFSVAIRNLWNKLSVYNRNVSPLEHFNLKTHACSMLLLQMNNTYRLNLILGFYRRIIWV